MSTEVALYEKGQIWECYCEHLHNEPFLVRLLRPHDVPDRQTSKSWHAVVLDIGDPQGNSSGWVNVDWFKRGPLPEMGVLAWAAE